MTLEIAVLVVLLLLSAFFSGSETAFFSLNHLEKDKLVGRAAGRRRAFVIGALNSPAEILITILTGNMIVNLFFASLMDGVVESFVSNHAWIVSIVIGTLLVLVFGEMTPKNLAIRHSLSFFHVTSRILMPIHTAFTPIRKLLKAIEHAIVKFISGRIESDVEDSRSLISSTFQIGVQKGIIHQSELSVLESFLDFREKTAEEVMIPRAEIHAIDAKTSIRELLKNITRDKVEDLIPVYREDVDHIAGYVNVRDMLAYRYKIETSRTVSAVMRTVHAVPETKNLMELLRELISNNCEVALVIDEYGGTAGLVTFQTLVEDFLYFFYPTEDEYKKVGDDMYLLPGSFELEKASVLLDVEFETQSRTISGYIVERLEEIPPPGAELRVDGYVFVVRTVSRKKILEVEARRVV